MQIAVVKLSVCTSVAATLEALRSSLQRGSPVEAEAMDSSLVENVHACGIGRQGDGRFATASRANVNVNPNVDPSR